MLCMEVYYLEPNPFRCESWCRPSDGMSAAELGFCGIPVDPVVSNPRGGHDYPLDECPIYPVLDWHHPGRRFDGIFFTD